MINLNYNGDDAGLREDLQKILELLESLQEQLDELQTQPAYTKNPNFIPRKLPSVLGV